MKLACLYANMSMRGTDMTLFRTLPSHRCAAVAAAGLLVAAFSAPAMAIPAALHAYDLNGSFADALGGNAITSGGGTLGPTGYTLDASNQGPSLTGPGITDHYSIEMKFSIDSTSGFKKLIDFKNRGSDTGLYNLNSAQNFYNVATGPGGAYAAGSLAHLVVTRDGTTDLFTAFVDGVQQISFTDSGDLAVISSNILHFLRDDAATGGEQTTGFIDYIRIFDTVLSQPDVADLFNGEQPDNPGGAIPEPRLVALFGLGLAGLGFVRRQRQRT